MEDNGEEKEGKRRRRKGEKSEIKVEEEEEEEEEEGIEGTGDLVAIPRSGNPADCFGRRYQERAKSFLWGGQPAERQQIFFALYRANFNSTQPTALPIDKEEIL